MGIGEAARFLGVSVVTLRRWHRAGRLSPRWRTEGGHRRYGVDDLNAVAGVSVPQGKTICYARVSSHDQKDDLQRQADRLRGYAETHEFPDIEVITDLGSGLNYRKRGLQRLIGLICRREVGTLVLTHKDRLLRFGADLVFSICKLYGVAGDSAGKQSGEVRGPIGLGCHRVDDGVFGPAVWTPEPSEQKTCRINLNR